MKYKNDASFVFGQDLYMFEQQASKNPNMPLRFLHYVSDVYREMYPNSELHSLRGYMTFINKVNEKKYSENKNIRTAVTEAVDECIVSGILSDFFSEHREEVIDLSVYDYDMDEIMTKVSHL